MDITTIVQESILKGWLGLYPKKTHKTTNKIQSQNTLFNYLDFDKKLDDFFDKVMEESGFKKEITNSHGEESKERRK